MVTKVAASALAENLSKINESIVQALLKTQKSKRCVLVAVSKYKPAEDIKAVYDVD